MEANERIRASKTVEDRWMEAYRKFRNHSEANGRFKVVRILPHTARPA